MDRYTAAQLLYVTLGSVGLQTESSTHLIDNTFLFHCRNFEGIIDEGTYFTH